jgi:hypothetical protein
LHAYALKGAAAGFYLSVPPSIVRSPKKQKLVRACHATGAWLAAGSKGLSLVKGLSLQVRGWQQAADQGYSTCTERAVGNSTGLQVGAAGRMLLLFPTGSSGTECHLVGAGSRLTNLLSLCLCPLVTLQAGVGDAPALSNMLTGHRKPHSGCWLHV